MKTKRPHMPALTRTFATLDRCQQHPGELLTMGGECVRCDREALGKQLAEQKIRTWIERGDPSKDASL